MSYAGGKLYGKCGSRYIPLIMTSEDVDRLQLELQNREREIEELRRWTSVNGVLALVDERDHWKAAHDEVCRKLAFEIESRDENARLADEWKAEAERWRSLQYPQ